MSKLYRSRRDSKLFGLCGGLAETLNVDSTLLRLVVVITTFFSGGTVIPIYVLACLVIPREPVYDSPFAPPRHYNPNVPPYTGGGYTPPHTGGGAGYGQPQQPHSAQPQQQSNLDEMMKDIEKKAMQKEIEELRARLAKLENEKGDK
jgi:phage shock protein PspC (stress-responsive transcriptional regulator)